MAHNLEQITNAALSKLTIFTTTKGGKKTEARITKIGGFHLARGLRIQIADAFGGNHRKIDILGEDLYALREFLAELPEEAFVRPADPVEKPERWAEGDIFDEWLSGMRKNTWIRGSDGKWRSTTVGGILTDSVVEIGLSYSPEDRFHWAAVIVRQGSGQDL